MTRVYILAQCGDGEPEYACATLDKAKVPAMLDRYPAEWVKSWEVDGVPVRLAEALRNDQPGAHSVCRGWGGLCLTIVDIDANPQDIPSATA